METVTEMFGEVIHAYTREQAIEDGVLVDVTEWASAEKGFHGGFTCPVVVTSALWNAIEMIPKSATGASVRGRAHDVLWMASLAVRGMIKRDIQDGHFKVGPDAVKKSAVPGQPAAPLGGPGPEGPRKDDKDFRGGMKK